MTCRGENHDGPVSVKVVNGEDRQGHWWRATTYTCAACGKSWTHYEGPGI